MLHLDNGQLGNFQPKISSSGSNSCDRSLDSNALSEVDAEAAVEAAADDEATTVVADEDAEVTEDPEDNAETEDPVDTEVPEETEDPTDPPVLALPATIAAAVEKSANDRVALAPAAVNEFPEEPVCDNELPETSEAEDCAPLWL